MASDLARIRAPWRNLTGREWPISLIVMRHATHSNGLVGLEGTGQIRDVARSLAEWCLLTKTVIVHFDAYTTDEKLGREVVATARIMRRQFRAAEEQLQRVDTARRVDQLHPALTPVYASKEDFSSLRVIVLNEPQAGEFINALSGLSIELQRGEVILLERANHWARVGGWPYLARVPYRARWTMAPHEPDGDDALQQIREKIASKMRTAGVLGGLITTLLTFVLTRLFNRDIPWGIPAFSALVAFGVSATLFFVTMFFYDSLTMPSRFWGPRAERSRWKQSRSITARMQDQSPEWLLARPPSPTIRVLQLNMVRTWSWVFVPAILALGIGVAALVIALDAQSTEANDSVDLGLAHTIVLMLIGFTTAGWSIRFRPQLGASD